MPRDVYNPCGGESYPTFYGTKVYLCDDKERSEYLDIWWHDGDSVATVETAEQLPVLGEPYDTRQSLFASRDGRRIMNMTYYRYSLPLEHLKWVHECPNPDAHKAPEWARRTAGDASV